MNKLEIPQKLEVLKKLKEVAELKIAKHKQDIEDWDSCINEIQSTCKHDFKCKSLWVLNQCTCKICGIEEIG